jgi:signal transduction histidine kinase
MTASKAVISRRLMAQERFTVRRIVQALHDQLGQQLSSARLPLDMACAPGRSQASSHRSPQVLQ